MKKKYVVLLLGILLIGGIFAGVGILTNEKEIPSEDYDKLKSVNSLEVTASKINCGSEYCDIVYINTGYGHTSYEPKPYWEDCTKYLNETGECLEWEKIYYTNKELEAQKDEKIEDLKNRIIKRLDINEAKKESKEEKVPESITEYKKEKAIPIGE